MKTLLNLKTDVEVKRKAKKVAEDLGLPLSTIINAYLKELVRTREVHFSAAPHRMTKRLEKHLVQVEKDIKKGKNLSPAFDNMDDAISYLHHA